MNVLTSRFAALGLTAGILAAASLPSFAQTPAKKAAPVKPAVTKKVVHHKKKHHAAAAKKATPVAAKAAPKKK